MREGRNVTFTCNATGVPPPLVTWFRRPSELKVAELGPSACVLTTAAGQELEGEGGRMIGCTCGQLLTLTLT